MVKYVILNDISTRKSNDPENKDWNRFIEYPVGKEVDESEFPKHVDIKYLLEGEHIKIKDVKVTDPKTVTGE